MSRKGDKHFGATIIDEVLQMKDQGKTNRQITEYFGLEKVKVVKNLLERHWRRQRRIEEGIMPRPKGRARKSVVTGEAAKDARIRQLEMEIELLRAFRFEFGRR